MNNKTLVSIPQATLLVFFMWFAYFLNYADRQAVFSMFPSLKVDLGMSDSQLGLTGAIFLWVYAIGCLIAGQLGDRYSKRLLVILSIIIWSIVTLATGFAQSVIFMLVLRALMGISESLFMPTAIALTANAHPPSLRSRAIAVLTTAQIAGTIGGSWFGGWMADQGRWREAFFILGAIGLIYAIPYFLFLRKLDENPTSNVTDVTKSITFIALIRVRSYIMLCLIFPVFVFGLWLLYGWFPTFLHDKFDLNQSDSALNATVYIQITTAIGLLGGGILSDFLYRKTKASRLWVMTAGLFLCAPCMHLMGSSETLEFTRIAAAGFGLFSGLFMGNIFPAAFEVVPFETRASAVGVLNFFGAVMSGFATLFGGMWKQSLGINNLLSLTSLLYLLAGMAMVIGIKKFFKRDYKPIMISS